MNEQKPTWTEDELKTFDRLIDRTSSRDQLTRINARLEMTTFVNEHGRDKCDAMFAELEKGRAK